jgi:hypothetical protein
MRYGLSLSGVLSMAIVLLSSIESAQADSSSSSASARITLHIAPRAELQTAAENGASRLCLYHIPARRLRVKLPGLSQEQELIFSRGNSCAELPQSTGGQFDGQTLLISAE